MKADISGIGKGQLFVARDLAKSEAPWTIPSSQQQPVLLSPYADGVSRNEAGQAGTSPVVSEQNCSRLVACALGPL